MKRPPWGEARRGLGTVKSTVNHKLRLTDLINKNFVNVFQLISNFFETIFQDLIRNPENKNKVVILKHFINKILTSISSLYKTATNSNKSNLVLYFIHYMDIIVSFRE